MSRTNPFPGINPFMEQTWPDVHLSLIGYIRDALGIELPEDLVAKGEQQIEVFDSFTRKFVSVRPDVAVVDTAESWTRGLPPVWTPDDAQPIQVTEPKLLTLDEPPHRWVEVRTDLGDLITVIEVLSPANKTTHREAYRTKRRNYVAAGVNVVEIDLLRSGDWIVDADRATYERTFGPRREPCMVCVSRGMLADRRELYPCALRERLPVIRIPLRPTDPDVPLDLQALVDRCYATGRYWKLDYTRALLPAPDEADAEWIASRLREAGLGT